MIDIEAQPCPGCGVSAAPEYLFEKAGDGRGLGKISLYRCGSCRTVYLGRYSESYDDDLYAYYRKYQGRTKEELYDPLTLRSYIKVLRLLSTRGGGTSILDVGCGTGAFVDAALAEGYKAEGIELAQPAVDIACVYGLPVKNLDFFSAEIQECSKDVLTMFEVIEHLPDPVAFLRRAEMVVKPGGLIYITTPNFNSIDRRVLGARWDAIHREHLCYFTPSTLMGLIRRNTGLELIHSETRNISEQLIRHIKVRVSRPSSRNGGGRAGDDFAPAKPMDLRANIENSPLLSLLKRSANSVLNASSLGSTIFVLLRRPE